MDTTIVEILDEIENEIQLAKSEHEEDNEGISFNTWMTIIGEEYGEACQAILKSQEISGRFREDVHDSQKLLMAREELIQVAGVAVSIIEQIDNENYKGV